GAGAGGGGGGWGGRTPPLETRGLSKSARRGWALKDLTLTIPDGAVVGLAGPNGAGKSTLLQLAVGLLAPTEGEIRVLGGDPWDDAQILARVGYVPQDGALYRSFTVAATMRFARETNSGWDEAFAVDLLAGLEVDRRVSALNAGERARLALALALGKRPALLLLDEPFARLDPLAAREFLQML